MERAVLPCLLLASSGLQAASSLETRDTYFMKEHQYSRGYLEGEHLAAHRCVYNAHPTNTLYYSRAENSTYVSNILAFLCTLRVGF